MPMKNIVEDNPELCDEVEGLIAAALQEPMPIRDNILFYERKEWPQGCSFPFICKTTLTKFLIT